ncbi:coiled-coil domain-containing protein 92 isoform X1 [Scleropages formosus]|uniref:Coiled-coil domain containing 92 n=2 Tax=Scleropages formosus TaxID=113540 RepID=A0A8C9TG78_SCLFO|nr:coiled-coil domain-containing protein 92 isoform X1 [Scleropages formosus]XP_029115576.1 coiled-coil domain-containing protein 92 isoform X1 [Scleropages formosus]XP_029115577.1 coiled-coil domain-containing protein 92 isoform X1 [Scleropages formosus]XP_029115578.1 coiled-coil domain-containing protein 92 isoform X1 [Scleropages formosus]
MASVSLENQLQSAQKNLLFLQQDHANTLKGLHSEIRRLQQHCTDLTYELIVKSSDPADSGEARCMELRRRCEELEAQLKAKEEENTELMHELEQKNAMISVLENTIKEREKKYLEELKLKSHKLAVLSGELEQRAGTIAYLTAQLHATKKRLLAGSSSDGSPTASPVSSYKPTPPPKDRQPETPRRRMKKSLSQPLHSEYAELYRLGADGRRLVLRDALDAMPDPTPFLQAREAAEAQVPRERPAVIPPIGAARERSPAPPAPPSGASPRHSPARHTRTHVGVAHRIHRAAPPAAQPESPTVDPVDDTKMANKQPGADRTV